jgi:type I restriction enzyme M protein
MALMNLYVHGAERPTVEIGDALSNPESEARYDVVVANPPFGSRSGPRPSRENFWVRTGNKQVNFVQHIILSLRPGGRAAIVLPDNCFAGDVTASHLWGEIFSRHRVHTILRLPKGTFAPYTAGVMTNVVFVSTDSGPTDFTWVYDARSNRRVPTGRRPLERAELDDFVACFGKDPDGRGVRSEDDSPEGRWSRHTHSELEARSYKLERPRNESDMAPGLDVDSALASAEDDLNAALDAIRELRRIARV